MFEVGQKVRYVPVMMRDTDVEQTGAVEMVEQKGSTFRMDMIAIDSGPRVQLG